MHYKRPIHFLLVGLIIFLITISNNFEYSFGELSFVEIFQLILLVVSLLIQFVFKRNFLTKYTSLQYGLRILLFVFLIYEELSFLTNEANNFFTQSNIQSEINIHNAIFMQKLIINFNFPLINYSGSIALFVALSTLASFIWGFGSYIPFLKSLNFITLNKEFAFYSFIYFLPIFLNSIASKIFYLDSFTIIHPEYIELFIYILLIIDVSYKLKPLRKN